jgi:uncharacterized Fe-S cluster-containing protein
MDPPPKSHHVPVNYQSYTNTNILFVPSFEGIIQESKLEN